MGNNRLTFETLVSSIQQVHDQLATQATKAVNVSLTLRNWMIGLYIAEFELRGADRTNYGDQLFSALAKQLPAVVSVSAFLQALSRNCGYTVPTITTTPAH